jgi:hypothetical protein
MHLEVDCQRPFDSNNGVPMNADTIQNSIQRTIDSTEVAATGFRNGDFPCRDIGES